MSANTSERRFAILKKARKRFGDLRLALVEHPVGRFTIKPLTGVWERVDIGPGHFEAHEISAPVMMGDSLDDIEKLLGMR